MNLNPRCHDKVISLIHKGVDIPNPLTMDIGDEVNVDQISGKGVILYPGCRIYGNETVISAGCRIGYEGSVTLDKCQLGPNVELKGGYFNRSVFLEKANMGSGAQVREGCILEEEANGAHCVGLKQTILFPFVTLGSLINFCDCLMAGGTSRKDHSEVGSSYVHFNFTPDGDKTTASLFGDVPRGVMLNQPPIFLGGQGGAVGPCRIGYGNIVAANAVLRRDVLEDNRLIVEKAPSAKIAPFVPRAYPNFRRIVENNLIYLANLKALEEWYIFVRRPFFEDQEFGRLIFSGLLNKLALAKKERIKRLQVLAEKAESSSGQDAVGMAGPGRAEFFERFAEIEALFASTQRDNAAEKNREDFLSAFEKAKGETRAGYLTVIQNLSTDVSSKGTRWLQRMVDALCEKTKEIVPSLNLFHI
ncbi:UDP-N-acetylglucosamine/UDP-N-acetylgalactosaminediphosphorylase [Syntrophus gentianae]|uniref:UDP-N-acetylglucosamine/UDP-N-acetylgalactosamine diphosphorylase n=1 Tax=Syntrophus gentianae TaxID=43775 RepID=A0A1H7WH38_9BACT|nr:UDP-N-acetylglucosamine pyrophosphorylase [Syntrophus gentianae]SEM20207.1 UDP-N-acetylglucosamine/UDP-N-acetylgalactosaminediphosphorylase [Syntrophus gentianae]